MIFNIRLDNLCPQNRIIKNADRVVRFLIRKHFTPGCAFKWRVRCKIRLQPVREALNPAKCVFHTLAQKSIFSTNTF